MKTQIKKIEDATLELSVELGKEELLVYISKAEREFGKELAIAGFRKGKAPQELLEKHLDKQQVLQVALEDALQVSLAQAIVEQKLDVLQTKDLKILENSAEHLKYRLVMVVLPAIDLPALDSFKSTRQTTQVQEKEISEALDVIRNWRATFTPKEDAAQTGDRVEVDFQVRMAGELIKGGESQSHPLVIGGKSFMPGFEDQLVGMKKDEEKKFSLVAPEDYYQKDLAGKKLDFEVKMKLVQQVKLPDLDDAFVKSLGKFNDVGHFRQNIRDGIFQEKEEKERERARLQVLENIIETVKFQPPAALVEEHLNRLIGNFDADLHAKGMELGMYLAHIGKTQDELRKDWQADAAKQARIQLVLRAVVKNNDIHVSEEEIDGALNQTVQALVSRGQTDPSQLNLQDLRGHIVERLLNEKALEHIDRTCVS